jgi:hypothetical protein
VKKPAKAAEGNTQNARTAGSAIEKNNIVYATSAAHITQKTDLANVRNVGQSIRWDMRVQRRAGESDEQPQKEPQERKTRNEQRQYTRVQASLEDKSYAAAATAKQYTSYANSATSVTTGRSTVSANNVSNTTSEGNSAE